MHKNIYLFSISKHDKAISINSLDINFFKPKIDFKEYDYLIITSKQTSEALKQYENKEYINLPALCVSKQSALSFEKLGGKVLDIGGGYGDNLISKIENYPKNTKWLYLRAKIVASDFVKVCKDDGFLVDEEIVYESDCSKEIQNIKVEDDATLIFTSPSSVKCFLKNNTIKTSNKVIIIGKTTAKSLPKDIDFIISKETTIESCMQEALSHY